MRQPLFFVGKTAHLLFGGMGAIFRGNFKNIWRNDLKKLFEQIVSGSLRQLPAEVTAENAPEGDAEEHFKTIVKSFEIASLLWKMKKRKERTA